MKEKEIVAESDKGEGEHTDGITDARESSAGC